MKRTLIAICITTVALAVGATAEEQHQNRAAGGGKGKAAAATTSARVNRGGSVQRSHQFSGQQNVRQNTSTRTFNQRATVNNRVRANRTVTRSKVDANSNLKTESNARTNRVTSRERGLHRNQATVNNNTVTTNTANRERFNRGQNVTRRGLANETNRNVTVNRTRNVNRNVTVVNNWRGERFAGRNYAAFRNYRRSFHDRGWWHSHYGNSLIFVFGAPYYWNSGYWYPAWGYNPGYVYPYDGPIYGNSTLTPDQIVENVQQQLRDEGYYDGPIDGVLGSQTRYALAAFQADHGLAVTSAVDEPTLSSLGLV